MSTVPEVAALLPPAKTDAEWLEVAQVIHRKGLEELAHADSLHRILDSHHKLQAIDAYIMRVLKDRDTKMEAANELTALRLRQERWMGQWLQEHVNHTGSRGVGNIVLPTLPEGISNNQSSRWQRAATLPEPAFEAHLAKTCAAGKELTSAGVHQRAKEEQRAATWRSHRAQEQAPILPDSVTLWHGDFAECGAQIPDASVDLILTDPPYGLTWLPAMDTLGGLAARVLKPGGSLLVMYGQCYLPEALHALSAHLDYQWTLCYRMHAHGVAIWPRRVENHWKPVLWYQKGAYEGGYQGDFVVSGSTPDKTYHPWGQAAEVFEQLVTRFTAPGEVILDPLCGGGTTGAVALQLRRRFIGIDADAEAIATTQARLAALRRAEEEVAR